MDISFDVPEIMLILDRFGRASLAPPRHAVLPEGCGPSLVERLRQPAFEPPADVLAVVFPVGVDEHVDVVRPARRREQLPATFFTDRWQGVFDEPLLFVREADRRHTHIAFALRPALRVWSEERVTESVVGAIDRWAVVAVQASAEGRDGDMPARHEDAGGRRRGGTPRLTKTIPRSPPCHTRILSVSTSAVGSKS